MPLFSASRWSFRGASELLGGGPAVAGRDRADPVASAAPRGAVDRSPLYRPGLMLRTLFVSWALLAGVFALTAWIVSGVEVTGGVWGYIWVSALFGVINALVGTILRILTLPLTVVTLGLFSVVVNAVVLKITAHFSSHLAIDSFFWTAIWAAIILSLVSVVLDLTVGRSLSRAHPAGR